MGEKLIFLSSLHKRYYRIIEWLKNIIFYKFEFIKNISKTNLYLNSDNNFE
jgi:hypothetical protein